MNRWKLFYSVCWLFISPFILIGQQEVLSFHQLSVADNLTSQTFNYYLFRDSYDFVWISSINGLNRFDGRRVEQYHSGSEDTSALFGENVYSNFFEDTTGNIWFSTNEAIHCYDRRRNSFHPYFIEEADEGTQREYQVLYLDRKDHRLWVRYKQELFILSLSNPEEVQKVGTFPMQYRRRLVKLSNDKGFLLFISTNKGIEVNHIIDKGGIEVKKVPWEDNLRNIRAYSFQLESDSLAWIGVESGLMKLNLKNGHFHIFNEFQGRSIQVVRGLAMASEDRLIVATEKEGIYFFDKTKEAFTHQLSVFQDGEATPFLNPVYDIYFDPEQVLWVSSPGQGIYFASLKKRKFENFLEKDVVKTNDVRSVTEDSKGRIWCLTPSGIVVLGKGGRVLPGYEHLSGEEAALAQGQPFYIFCDREDRIWVCTIKGLFLIRPETGSLQKIPSSPATAIPGVVFINQLSNGKLLASSQAAVLMEVVEQQEGFQLQPMGEDAVFRRPYTGIFKGSNDMFYVTEEATGIRVFREEKNRIIQHSFLPIKPQVNVIVTDTLRKKLWVGTSAGLFFADTELLPLELQKLNEFPIPALNGLLQDSRGRLWASTNQGIVRYDPETAAFRIYGEADGIQAPEFNFWSFSKVSAGRFAFGGVNGLNIFDPMEIRDLQTPANPTLTRLLVNDEEATGLECATTGATNVTQLQKLVLPYSQNTLSFYFSALEYSDPAATQFQYRMKGVVDDHFVDAGTDNFTRYANLPPGDHIFEVRASNSDGVWAPDTSQLAITIRPPWYQTWWFYTLLALSFLLIVYAVYRQQVRRIEFRRKEAEYKQKQAEYQQQIAEIETSVLRLQMNPHFIFNSMNSISSYILKKDVSTANDYLGRFAKLMRMILKFAEKPFIDISTEMELLQQYLDTEKMRFHKEFDYEFEVGPEVDPDDVVIPTMILQPFVENAIWHGLAQKKGRGTIRIVFKIENEQLHCSIEDDGVGRHAAQEQSLKAKQHESKALAITARRLHLLEEQEGEHASYRIEDLVDDRGRPAGTRVVLQMPVLQ